MTSLSEQRQTILVVEDNVFIRLDIAGYLRQCGYHVIEAENAAEAIDVLESQSSIDLIFSDIQMPGDMDGFGLARWAKKHQRAVKVILTSGYIKVADETGELYADGPMI